MTRKPFEQIINGEVHVRGWYDDDPAAVPRFGFTVHPGHVTPSGQIVDDTATDPAAPTHEETL